ncbi:hypothetical protein B0H10DRAFT_1948192 [Mycena sp. CBHHK59/15]|nr:hypothetical protein B0H10DRAFT_1948192 [Mycena sp. CBHHK59/15]
MSSHRKFTSASFVCPEYRKLCKSAGGLTQHHDKHVSLPTVCCGPPAGTHGHEDGPSDAPPPANNGAFDPNPSPPPSPGPEPAQSPPPHPTVPPAQRGTTVHRHLILDGTPCDINGHDLPPGALPPPWDDRAPNDYSPLESRAQFEFAEFLYTQQEMLTKGVDRLAQLLTALYQGTDPPFADHKDLYTTIDSIQQGDIPWESFSVKYTGPVPETREVPVWMTETFEVWFHSPLAIFEKQLANPDFKDEMDWAPKRIFKKGKCQFTDFFSRNWVWEQADKITANNPESHGTMFVPGIFGSDKTTVSVGMGNTEFYPFYGGIGNIHNSTCRAHRKGLSVMAFLSIPKTTWQHAGSKEFRKFRRQLFHSSIRQILQPLKPYMKQPRITRCADGHFRHAIYGLGPLQIIQNKCLSPAHDLDRASARRCTEHTEVLLEGSTLKELWDDFGIPFTTDFLRADIHKLILMDLLHQILKGTFKDHVVDWVEIIYEFPVSRGFKQWTGNDSKGLMKATFLVKWCRPFAI